MLFDCFNRFGRFSICLCFTLVFAALGTSARAIENVLPIHLWGLSTGDEYEVSVKNFARSITLAGPYNFTVESGVMEFGIRSEEQDRRETRVCVQPIDGAKGLYGGILYFKDGRSFKLFSDRAGRVCTPQFVNVDHASVDYMAVSALRSTTSIQTDYSDANWAELRFMRGFAAPSIAQEHFHFRPDGWINCRSREQQIHENQRCWGLSDLQTAELAERSLPRLSQMLEQIGPDGENRGQTKFVLQRARLTPEDLDAALVAKSYSWNAGMNWADVLQVRIGDYILFVAFYTKHDYPKTARNVPVDAAIVRIPDEVLAEGFFREAYSYDTGSGVDQDESRAAELYRKAADLGHGPATRNLAGMYGSGRGVETDQEEASSLFLAAAELGDAQSQYAYANWYAKSQEEKKFWFERAANQGHVEAKEALGELFAAVGQQDAQPPTSSQSNAENLERYGAWNFEAVKKGDRLECVMTTIGEAKSNNAPTDRGTPYIFVIYNTEGGGPFLQIGNGTLLDNRGLHYATISGNVYPFVANEEMILVPYARDQEGQMNFGSVSLASKALLKAMARGDALEIGVRPKEHSEFTDLFRLDGLDETIQRAEEECR